MHGINLEDLALIRQDLKASNLMTYQIMDFSESNPTVVVYMRMIDLRTMKVITSGLIKVGDDIQFPVEKRLQLLMLFIILLKILKTYQK